VLLSAIARNVFLYRNVYLYPNIYALIVPTHLYTDQPHLKSRSTLERPDCCALHPVGSRKAGGRANQ
jgi:hypothetical protein